MVVCEVRRPAAAGASGGRESVAGSIELIPRNMRADLPVARARVNIE